MATLITTAGHKQISLPHSPTTVVFVDGVAEVDEAVAAEVLEHFATSVKRIDPPKTSTKKTK